jgi:ABC-2 type transport system permease protein
MKQIRLLLGLRLRALAASMFARSKYKVSGIGALLLLAVLFGMVFVSFGFVFFSLFSLMCNTADIVGSDPSLYLSLAAALTLGLCLFGSTFTAQSQLYQAKDNEFLLAMPLSPAAIFASRVLLLVFLNIAYGSTVALPAFIVYCLYDFTVWGALRFVFFFLLILFAALAISCLLGWLIALVSSRIKRKNLVTIVFSIGFLALYFGAFFAMDTLMAGMEENLLNFTAAAAPYLAPFALVSAGILGTAVLGPALFALAAIAAIVIVAAVLIGSYTAILTANRGGVDYVYREKKAKRGSPLFAVIRKELRCFVGNPGYLLNAGLGLVFAPALGVLMLLFREKVFSIVADPELSFLLPLLPALIAAASVFLCSIIFISAPSISLEAKNLWILQSMPISARTVLLGKAYFHILISAPFFLLFSILSAVALSASPLDFLGLLLLPQAASAFCAFFGTTVGFLIPKFDWTSETAAVKSSVCASITMLGMMIIGLLSGGVAALPFLLGLPAAVGPLAATLALFGGSFGFFAYLSGPAAARRFARLQN